MLRRNENASHVASEGNRYRMTSWIGNLSIEIYTGRIYYLHIKPEVTQLP